MSGGRPRALSSPLARVAAHAPPGARAGRVRVRGGEHLGPAPPSAVRGAAAAGPRPNAGRGPGPSIPSPSGVSSASARARDGRSGRPSGRCRGSSVRERPAPARAAPWAGAPWARRGSRAAGASGEGAPEPRSAGVGRDRGRVLRAPRMCDLAGPRPALNRSEQTRALGMQATPWGTQVPGSVFILHPMGSQGFLPPHPPHRQCQPSRSLCVMPGSLSKRICVQASQAPPAWALIPAQLAL